MLLSKEKIPHHFITCVSDFFFFLFFSFLNLARRIDRGEKGDRSRKNNKRVKTNGHDRRSWVKSRWINAFLAASLIYDSLLTACFPCLCIPLLSLWLYRKKNADIFLRVPVPSAFWYTVPANAGHSRVNSTSHRFSSIERARGRSARREHSNKATPPPVPRVFLYNLSHTIYTHFQTLSARV